MMNGRTVAVHCVFVSGWCGGSASYSSEDSQEGSGPRKAQPSPTLATVRAAGFVARGQRDWMEGVSGLWGISSGHRA